MGKTTIPENFALTDEMRKWAKYKTPSVDIEKQFEMFVDYWKGHGKKMLDWTATWRMWMRRAPEFERPVNQYGNFERSRPRTERSNFAPTSTVAPAANRFDNSPRFPDPRYRKQ